ncbi:MAG: agmatinase [Phycisphaerae bacterium]|nr:agmatinase [Phycisphaerae bacterium]NIP55476.1 agmatinase [Phycisphaerae bacterium]NIS54181.1 agmatinase [Phycisphaerae bacterium]NIU11785.1 agmatinase [Phycisphaerae bacterium]NIU59608.1 agmatinase [Phycisphaerae bacterium]
MNQPLNFGYLPEQYSKPDKSSIVVIPVPYDGTSTWIKGADKGPEAIIEASANMELYDIETDSEVYTKGIFTDNPVRGLSFPEEVIETLESIVGYHIEDGKFVVVMGGEHSISIGSVKAHVKNHKDLTVLQLDAHSDLRDEYNGSKYSHACVMARIAELCPFLQVGIRSMDASEKKRMDKQRTFLAEDINTDKNWIKKVTSKLSESTYITIDLDVFDPSAMPSTGTPEPGGLFWYDVLALLKAVSEKSNIVGFDVVELCPDEKNKAPDFLAAKLIYKLLSYKFGA